MKTTTYKPLKNNFTLESKKIIALVAILLTAFFSSCSEDGAEGSVGAAGKDGTNGTVGATGATGATGSANVIYSDWVPTGTVTAGTIAGSVLGRNFTILAPKLTQDILDKGSILVYYQATSSGSFRSIPLPWTVDYSDGTSFNLKYYPGLGEIKVAFYYSDGQETVFSTSVRWRYVLIPGGVSATGKTAKIEYYKMSYEEVCTHFNIQP